MSDPNVKGVKRTPSRPTSRQYSSASSAKNRALADKTRRPKPLVKRSSSEKAPARKAAKSTAKSASTGSAKSAAAKRKPAKTAPPRRSTTQKRVVAKPATSKLKAKPTAPKRKVSPRKPAPQPQKRHKAVTARAAKTLKAKPKPLRRPISVVARKPVPPPPPPKKPTQDEAAALRAFERAHKEFARGRFGEARSQFRTLIEKYHAVSEVTARARTYLAVADSRLRAESSLPRDADSLYDRGVIELNRGEYVAAQEMFERALKREPQAAHIHYGLAATRSRMGSIDTALESLQRSLEIQPTLRVRALHDPDLTPLRNEPEFERMVFEPR